MPFYKNKNKEDILTFDKNNNNKKLLIKYLNIKGYYFFRIKNERIFKKTGN